MLQAGTSVVDITPPAGSLMACFPVGPERTPRRAEGAHDPLLAKTIVLSDGDEAMAVCACDVTMLREIDVQRIRRQVGTRLPQLGGPRLMLAATHTHSSPETTYLFSNTPDDPWIQEMDARIAKAIVAAHETLRPVHLKVARAHAELAHNRRVRRPDGRMGMAFEYDPEITTGPHDNDVPVLQFVDSSERSVAVVYNFAAHALTIGPGTFTYTADFPGVANGVIEGSLPGATALFLNGAAGNTHPRISMKRDFEATTTIGEALGDTVLEAIRQAQAIEDPRLGFAAERIRFPNRIDPKQQLEVELSCLRIGDVLAAFCPGEPFIEFQLRFKEAVRPTVGMFVGYANGSHGYIPTREAYTEGGYGVDLFTGDPPALSRTALPEGAGEAILERLIALARRCL